MQRLSVQPKNHRRLPIPDELRDAMRSACELIEQAKHDSNVNLVGGDVIEFPHLSGGRLGSESPFLFMYKPTDDQRRGLWVFTLETHEIEAIADGRMTEIPMYCCTSPDCQSKSSQADVTCPFCDYVEDPNCGPFSLPEALPRLEELGIHGLTSTSTRADVQRILGAPASTGGGIDLPPPIGYVHPWIKYSLPTSRIHFELEPDGAIRMITLEPTD